MPDGSNTQAEQPMQMRQPSIIVGPEGKPQDGQHAPPPSMAPFVPPQSPDTTQKSSMPPQSPSVLSEEFGASSMNHAASLEKSSGFGVDGDPKDVYENMTLPQDFEDAIKGQACYNFTTPNKTLDLENTTTNKTLDL